MSRLEAAVDSACPAVRVGRDGDGSRECLSGRFELDRVAVPVVDAYAARTFRWRERERRPCRPVAEHMEAVGPGCERGFHGLSVKAWHGVHGDGRGGCRESAGCDHVVPCAHGDAAAPASGQSAPCDGRYGAVQCGDGRLGRDDLGFGAGRVYVDIDGAPSGVCGGSFVDERQVERPVAAGRRLFGCGRLGVADCGAA